MFVILPQAAFEKYGVPEGTPLKNTVLEFCLKSDEYGDPMMNESQITALGIASQEDLDILKNTALRVNNLLSSLFDRCGIILWTLSLNSEDTTENHSCGRNISGFVPFWDKATGDKMDKDRFRRDLGDVLGAYREVLRRLKNAQQV